MMTLARLCKCILITVVLMATPVASMATDDGATKRPDITLPVKNYLLPENTEKIRDSLNDPIFLACKEHAMPVGKKGVLGVCTRYDDISGQTDAVVYDSTDEVEKQPSGRSQEWKDVAFSSTFRNTFHFPFNDGSSLAVTHIVGHYYRVVLY
jgi:hypothetical protein